MKKIFIRTLFFIERGAELKILQYLMIILLVTQVLSSCKKNDTAQEETVTPEEVVDTDLTALTQKLQTNTQVIATFKSDSFKQVADGVSQTQISFLNKLGLPVNMFILEVDLRNAKLGVQALLPYNDYLNAQQTLSEMCRDNQKNGKKIVAAINGDFFNAAGAPEGWFYIDGFALKTTRTSASKSYFGVLKDKSPLIGGVDPVKNTEVPGVVLANIQQAVGGRQWLVKDALLSPTATDVAISARTAIGYTSTNVVYAIVVDGGQEDYSVGMGIDDLGRIMIGLGATRAINLGGGQGSTMVVKSQDQNNWIMQNQQPKKLEYTVANGIGFVISE